MHSANLLCYGTCDCATCYCTLGAPEQPRQLLTYMKPLGSNPAARLPVHIIESIVAATAVNE